MTTKKSFEGLKEFTNFRDRKTPYHSGESIIRIRESSFTGVF